MTANRVALVTGAARGQGAAIVKRLHKDGFCVAACDLLSIDVGDDNVIEVPLDVTDEDQWATAVAATVERSIDFLNGRTPRD